MGTENNHYPGFAFAATELSAYAYSIGTFIISLKNGSTTQFSPVDVEDFRDWLATHRIRDVKIDDGISGTGNLLWLNKPKQKGDG